jgi:hypothetical protein
MTNTYMCRRFGPYGVGLLGGGFGFWFAPRLIEEEVAIAVLVGFGLGGCVEVHELPFGGRVVWPRREAASVGVAGAGEVGPVGADLVG